MSDKKKSLAELPAINRQVELIQYMLDLINEERERIKRSIAAVNHYSSDKDRDLWFFELNRCDRHYAELQSWQSALVCGIPA
ncbi:MULTISPECIES: hypothetical protein [unclassified Endozoicomonas]|uniref:hypothetical protein n=1 Tax=unclassified Endozoicomonas TaxID=2644528 RepID=UPI003BB7F4B1